MKKLIFILLCLSLTAQASSTRTVDVDSLKSSDHSKTYSLPASSDTLAGILPANSTNPTQTISASNIDWSAGRLFVKTLSANTTFTFSNQVSGESIIVRITNTASNYTVTWPAGVKWSGGTAPVQTIGAKADVTTFLFDGTDTYGNSVQNF